ncbi:MAG: ComEA family DNA-binding protein [Nitriliruptorales bacterium]|nr:ComEA family DNA-binding protein [Nitriliruptorales bacterium]
MGARPTLRPSVAAMTDSGDTLSAAAPGASVRSLLTRLGCSPAEAAALAVLVTGAVAGLGLLWVLSRPVPPETAVPDGALPLSAPDAGAAAAEGSAGPGGDALPGLVEATDQPEGAAPASKVVVHVAGQVAEPGLYRLPPGSRIGDALEHAGGPLPEARLDVVNLAHPLTDGEQVFVPGPDDVVPDPAGPGGATGGQGRGGVHAAGPLDLNRATAEEFQDLPGVGPVLAERIVHHREDISGFRTVDELRDVKGIGEKTFAELSPLVTVR